MKSPYLYKSSLVIKIALGTAILLIVYITSIFFNQMQNLGNSVDSMSASSKKLLELEKVLSVISTNESSVRSYLITRDSMYLKKRFFSRETLESQFDELAGFPPTSSRGFNPDTLKTMVNRRFWLFEQVLRAGDEKLNIRDKSLRDALAHSDTMGDKIRAYVYQSLEREASNVSRNAIDHRHEIETSIITSFLLVTIALFILLVSINRISSDLNAMKKQSDELRFLNYTFNNAEKIAGISHWKYNLRSKTYSFSDNFYNLVGHNPETFEPSIDNILPLIHPEDREHVMKSYKQSLANKTPTSLIFRLYTSNGNVRYIKSIGSFTKNSRGELVKIGVNYDISEQYQNTVNLGENNKHLRSINAELESFNNIVSHDLQEPLRKIQMFISRIRESESQNLTETGHDYFERIRALANRMQTLMIDLVNYSRTVKGDKVFVKHDMKKIIQEVLDELALNIEEKKAVVHVGKLPTASMIPFQIHQLFVNLITNALKFSKENVIPEITISREKMPTAEMREGFAFNEKKFYKIIVSDNGIGFRQEFSERIFQLFRRLEKESYEGTGIGLAICKKIVENHNGFIFAEGEPGNGARFLIYLPKG